MDEIELNLILKLIRRVQAAAARCMDYIVASGVAC